MSSLSNSSTRPRVGVGAVLFGFVFLIFYRIIMAHFYRSGGYLWDAGWFADVIWRNGIFPLNAEVVGALAKYQYQYHSFFLATPLSLISELLPFSAPQWFAVVTGLGHAAAALCVFAIAARCPAGFVGKPKVFLDALLAFAVIMNATVLESISYPHLEFLYFPAAALFCYAMLSENYLFIFTAILLVAAAREDAGFHLAAPFLLTFVLVTVLDKAKWLQRWPLERFSARQIVFFCVLPVVFAALSTEGPRLFVQKVPLLMDEYFGHPPYAHLLWSYVQHQASYAFTQLPYVWVPMLVLFCVAVASRSALLVAASLAYIPWLVFNLSAVRGTYFAYRAFPQFLMYILPLVLASGAVKFAGPQGAAEKQPARSQAQRILLYYSALALALISIVLLPTWLLKKVPDFAWLGAKRASAANTERFFQLFKTAKPALGVVAADESVIALAPRLFSLSERIAIMPRSRWAEITRAALKPVSGDGQGSARPDSFLFFEKSLSLDRMGAVLGTDYRVFRIAGTNMFLATTISLPITGLTTKLEPVSRVRAIMSTSNLAEKSSMGIHIHAQSQHGFAVYGPYVKLPAGRYRVRFFLANPGGGAAIPSSCDVDVFASGKTFARSRCIKPDDEKNSRGLEVPLDFRVDQQDIDRLFEFRVGLSGDADMELSDVTLEFCGGDNQNARRP